MPKIFESAVEDLAIERLIDQGYAYLPGPEIAPDSSTPLRGSFEDVLLIEKVKAAIDRLNPHIPPAARADALSQIQRFHAPELIANNEAFHRMLTEGVNVTYQQDGHPRGDLVWLVDFDHPENNEFTVVNQFTVLKMGSTNGPTFSCLSMAYLWL
jgi:type I restriction enzyme, R subunit